MTANQMYSKYAEIGENNLLLMENYSLGAGAVEEEFHESLRELSIDLDSVGAMEQLATDSYLSSVVSTGMYKGMRQSSSAMAANAFLFTSMVRIHR